MAYRTALVLQRIDYLPVSPAVPRFNGKNVIKLLEYIPHSDLLHSFVYARRKYALAKDTANVYLAINKRNLGRVIWENAAGDLVQLRGKPSEDDPLIMPYAELRDNSECAYIKELDILMFYLVHRGFVYFRLPLRGKLSIDSNALIFRCIYGIDHKLYVINNGAEAIDEGACRYKLHNNPAELLGCPSAIEGGAITFTWGGKKYILNKSENRLTCCN